MGLFSLIHGILILLLACGYSLQTLLIPIASDLDFTLDYRDELRFELCNMFSISPYDEGLDLKVSMTDLQMNPNKSTAVLPEVRIISERYHDGEQQILRNRLTLELKAFDKVPYENYGIFTALCVFVWKQDPELAEDYVPIFDELHCLEIHVRVKNGSLNYTQLNEMASGGIFRMSSEQFTGNMSMTTLTSGLLPDYLGYTMECDGTPGKNSSVGAQGPVLELNTEAVIFEPLEMEEGFVGDEQEYIDGYIVDYNLKNKFFRVLKADPSHELIRGIKPTHQCLDVHFFSLAKQYKEIFIICESDGGVEVMQIGFSVPNPATMAAYSKNTTSESAYQAVLSRLDRTEFPGKFKRCRFITLRQTLFCLEGIENPITKERDYSRNYRLLRLKMDPLNLLDRGNFSIEPFEEFFSQKMNKSRDDFSMEFLKYFEANRLVASVRETDGLTYLVALRCLKVIEQKCLKNNTLTIRNLSSLSYRDSEKNPSFCLTKSGTYSLSPDTKILSFVPRNSQSKLFSKDLSKVPGEIVHGECYQDTGLFLLSFIDLPHGLKDPVVTSILVDSRIVTDMPFKEEATVVYTPVTNIDGSTLIFAYHDPVLNTFSYYGKQDLDFEMKFTLHFSKPTYRLSVFDPGEWNCFLFGSQFSQQDLNTPEVPVLVDVRHRPPFAVGLLQADVNLGVRSHKFNTTLSLEDLIEWKAPLRNLKMKMKTENGTELLSGYITNTPRYKLKYFADVPRDGKGYDETLWVNNALVVCSRGMEIDLLIRAKNESSFNLSKSFHINHQLRFFGKLYSNVEFRQMETLDFFYDDPSDPKYLFLYGISSVFKYQLQWHSPKSYYRYLVIVCIELTTLIHLESAVIVIQFDLESLNMRFWQMLPPTANADGLNFELHFLRRFSKEESKFYSERITIDFVTSPKYQGFENMIRKESPIELALGKLYGSQYYWSELDRTTRLLVFITSEDHLRMQEYVYSDTGDIGGWKIIQDQALSMFRFKGALKEFECSRTWEICLFALDTNILVEIPFTYDLNTNTSMIHRVENDQYKWYPLLISGSVHNINIGNGYMSLTTSSANSDTLIYKRGQLEYPYLTIPDGYQIKEDNYLVIDCPLKVGSFDTCMQRELFMRSRGTNCIEILELTDLVVEFKDFSVDEQVSKFVTRIDLKFNDPLLELDEEFIMPFSISKSYSLNIHSDLEVLDEPPSKKHWSFLLFCCISLAVTVVLRCFNDVHYRYRKSRLVLGFLNQRDTDLTVRE